jgi:sugar lactone lactonase YvrE
VYGQGGTFTTNTVNKGGISANSLYIPYSVAVDISGNLYIFDAGNNRVLENTYDSSASKVYGQGGSFITNTTNKGGISASSLNSPAGGVFDKNGNLYMADQSNNRVLYYPAGSTTATRVYGQGGSFATNTANKGGVSAKSLYGPYTVALDGSGNLYVPDCNNNRVLYYPMGSTTATRVYGQGGSFTTNPANKGGISAKSLYCPSGIAVDKNGNLYISDADNSRVLYYPAGSTTATRVYGQGGSFTTNTANKGGISAISLSIPGLITLDGNGNLYVVDYENHRVLYYLSGSTTAIRVYGQSGSFTTNIVNKGGISAKSLYYPWGIAVDGSGNLYVADYGNSRVLYYPAGTTTATRVYGQGGSFTTNTQNNGGISANSLDEPYSVAVDSSGNLYVFDTLNNRVLVYK